MEFKGRMFRIIDYLRFFTLFTSMCIVGTTVNAQVSSYSFAQSSGSYSAIAGGTVLVTGTSAMDSWASSAITIPSFTFNGTAYTTAYVTSNGQISLGGAAPSSSTYTGISTGVGSGICICPFSADLDQVNSNASTEIRWQTVGNEVIFQWTQMKRYGRTENFDFQVRLNTTNNTIIFVYKLTTGPDASTSYQPQVGIRTSGTDYNNRKVTSGADTWATSLTGTVNNDVCRFTSTAPAKNFSSGLTYTWTPPVTPTITSLSSTSGCVGSSLVITGTNFTGVSAVKIGGTAVTSYTVDNSTQITAVVASGTTGTVSVTTPGGTATSAATFTVNALPTAPGAITSNSPQCNGTGVTFTKGSCSSGTCYWVSSATGTETTNSAATYTTATTSGTYNVWVRAYSGSCWSSAVTATGTVTAGPTITGQPANQSAAAGSGTATFTVTATGGTSYQWQEYISSWNNVSNGGVYSGATSANLVITSPGIGMNGYKYRCIVSGCSPTATSDGNATLTVSYCSPIPSNVDGNGITRVVFGTIDNPTGKEATNYGDYSAMSNSIIQGTTANVNITFSTGYTYGTKIWVDYNDDGDFLDAGELVYTGTSLSANPTTLAASFTASGAVGTHRMRIGGTDTDSGPANNASSTGYCYTSTYATFEDYTIIITAPLTPTITSLGSTSGCVGTSLIITGTNFTGATAVKIGGTDVTSYTVDNATQITTVIGSGTTGTVTVTTLGGTGTSAATFTVNTIPATPGAITSDSPQCNGTGITFTKGSCSSGTCYWVSSDTGTETTNSDGTYTTATTAGTYNVWVRAYSGACWSPAVTSSGTITASPAITVQPTDQSTGAGSGTPTFSVTATAGTSYQWQEYITSWTDISNGGVYSGATTSSLVITNPGIGMNGYKYRCIVSGCSPSATTNGNSTLYVTACASTSTNSSSYFDSFSTTNGSTNISNTSTGYSTNGYGDFSAMTVTQEINRSINFSTALIGTSVGVNIWIDWNEDGDFTDSDEIVYASGSYISSCSGTITVPATATVGTKRMRIRMDYNSTNPSICGSISRGETEDYAFVVTPASPMSFVSCTTSQPNIDAVAPFTTNAEVIGIQVITNGTLNPLNASYFSFLTNGSTNATVDIGAANLYYTGNSSTFVATNRFGSTKIQPNGRFSFTGTQQLSTDTNYFWLAYDIPLTATLGNIVDAQCDTVTVTTVRTPTTTNPTGSRTIGNVVIMNNNPETVCYANFYDNGGAHGNYTDGATFSKTFIPDAGKVMKIVFSSFNTSEVSDSLTIYNGPSNASPVIGKYYGASNPGTVIATNTGELTFSFKTDGMTNSTGWNALVTCEYLPPNCATLNTPLNNANNQPTNTPIVWTPGLPDLTHQAATSYKLYFGTDAAATNIHNGTNIGNVTLWGMMLNTSTTYYWKIVPVNASGEATGCTTIHSFTTDATQTVTTYNVPGDYATIKAAYNACTAATPYIINVTTGYSGETYPIAFNIDVPNVVNNRSAANPIIIRPSTGFSYTFKHPTNTILEFSKGAKYITIDGRQNGTSNANSFVFQDSSSTTPTINFKDSICNNTIQYCKVQGNNKSAGIINITSPIGYGIHDITIDNNEITKFGGTPSDGILTEGTGALKNTKITITNNKIYDIYADVAYATHGIYMGSNGFNDDCTISGNSVYLTSTVTPTSNSIIWYGILVKGNNHVVTSNYVGGTAASCGGTAMTIAGTKENHIYAITVVGTLASSTTNVENNTVNNISLSSTHRSADNLTARSATGSDHTFAGITITEGAAKVHNNTIGGPTAGSITVINTNTSNPSTWNDGSNWGYSAELVGIVYNTKNGTINNTGNTVQGLWCYPSSTATTNLNARVIGIYAYTNASDNSGYTHKIQNNTIGGTGGLKAGNNTTSDAFVYGIITSYGRGTIHIKNNTISNLWVNATGDYGYLRGIHNNGGIRAEIENNTISNLVCAANNTFGTGGDHRNRAIVGLMCDNDGGDCDYFFLIKNTVYDLRSTATSATLNMIGIYYRHNIAPVYGRVYGNKVYSINASTTADTSKLIGIWAYGQNTITYNNMVSLGNNVSVAAGASCPNAPLNSGNYQLIGIENNYGKNEYYYNTINIIGTSTGGSNTYAYKYVNPGTESLTRVFRNNIFSNTRSSTSGTQKNYAFSVSLQEAYGKFTSDYNYFYVSGTNGVLFDDFGTDRTTIAAWTASTGKDANSTGTGVLTPADPLFVAPCNCDCNLDITDLTSPIVGTGSTTGIPTFILDDFNSNNRNAINNAGAVIVGATTLPIELLSFTGEKVEKSTKLEWTTTSEVNNDYFTIERSMDGFHFEPIVKVKGAGNSNNLINYEVIDENPMKGINYYRLKQTDYDGVFSYSHVIAINFSDNPYMVHVYPNPFNQNLNINIEGLVTENADIQIIDITGKLVFAQSVNKTDNTFKIDLDGNLPNGVYFMKLLIDSSVQTFKIIKSNN